MAAPRYHHQFLPDDVLLEPGALSADVQRNLGERGHRLAPGERPYGNMQLIHWDRAAGLVSAASDPRGIGAAAVIPVEIEAGAKHARPPQPQTEPLRVTP